MNEKKHSAVGIASLVIGLASAIMVFLDFVAAGLLEAFTPGGFDADSVHALAIGLSLVVLMCISSFALGLGIGALMQKNQKQLFPVLGTVCAALTLMGIVIIVIIGIVMA